VISVCYLVRADDARATKAVRAACAEVGSISNIIFEMRFNPDIFSPGAEENRTHTHTRTHTRAHTHSHTHAHTQNLEVYSCRFR